MASIVQHDHDHRAWCFYGPGLAVTGARAIHSMSLLCNVFPNFVSLFPCFQANAS